MSTRDIPAAPGHPLYDRSNNLLREAGFDGFVKDLCEPYYVKGGHPSIPPGAYDRMGCIKGFKAIDSQRGIA